MAVKNEDEILQAIKKAEDNLESAKKELRLGGSLKSTKFYLARTIEASTEALYHMEPSEP